MVDDAGHQGIPTHHRAEDVGHEVSGLHPPPVVLLVDRLDEVRRLTGRRQEEPPDGETEAAGEGDDLGDVDVPTPVAVVGLLDR